MRADKRFKEAVALHNPKGKKVEAIAIYKILAQVYAYRVYDLYGYTKQFNTKNNPLSIRSRISCQLTKRIPLMQ